MWTNCGVFKGDFSLAPACIRGISFSEMLCTVGEKVVADVSGLVTDPFLRGRWTALGLEKGSIYCLQKSVTSRQNSMHDVLKVGVF